MERREGPEGEARETHYALRGQKRPLPGTRPAPLPVVAEPHGRLEAAARVSAGVPSLVLVALSSADEGVDAAALSFLVQQAVLAQEKEKEAKAKREKERQDARRAAEYLNSLTSKEEEEEQEKAPEGCSSSLWTSLCPSATSSCSPSRTRSRRSPSFSSSTECWTSLLCNGDVVPTVLLYRRPT